MPHVSKNEQPKQKRKGMPLQFVLVNLLLELIADELSVLNLFPFITVSWTSDEKRMKKKKQKIKKITKLKSWNTPWSKQFLSNESIHFKPMEN